MGKKVYLAAVLLVWSTLTVYCQSTVDVLIVGNPHAYSILNSYEQPLSPSQLNSFLPYSPLELVKVNTTLGDGITSSLKCTFNNEVFYLLRDDTGKLIGDSKNPYKQIFTKVQHVADTVIVMQSRVMMIAERYPSEGKKNYLPKDALCLRLFKYNNYYYVKISGTTGQFGWCQFPANGSWKKVVRSIPKEDKIINSALKGRIIARINAANKVYEQYFAFFNTITDQQKSIPRWRYNADDDRIECILSAPYTNTDQLEESTRFLVQDIENLLIGKPFDIQYLRQQITITARK